MVPRRQIDAAASVPKGSGSFVAWHFKFVDCIPGATYEVRRFYGVGSELAFYRIPKDYVADKDGVIEDSGTFPAASLVNSNRSELSLKHDPNEELAEIGDEGSEPKNEPE